MHEYGTQFCGEHCLAFLFQQHQQQPHHPTRLEAIARCPSYTPRFDFSLTVYGESPALCLLTRYRPSSLASIFSIAIWPLSRRLSGKFTSRLENITNSRRSKHICGGNLRLSAWRCCGLKMTNESPSAPPPSQSADP